MSVKITCNEKEERLFAKALMWLRWKEEIDLRSRDEERRRKGMNGGRVIRWHDHDLTISGRRTQLRIGACCAR